MRLPGATYFIRNNQFRGGKGKRGVEEERWRRALWLADLHWHWQILINALGGARRNTMPCNHFIMTNRNSNAVPCEPSRGKIELTVNCSCLGNGEEEKKGDWGGGEEDRQRVSRRRERREEDLACFGSGSVSGLVGLRRFHRAALVSAAPRLDAKLADPTLTHSSRAWLSSAENTLHTG